MQHMKIYTVTVQQEYLKQLGFLRGLGTTTWKPLQKTKQQQGTKLKLDLKILTQSKHETFAIGFLKFKSDRKYDK